MILRLARKVWSRLPLDGAGVIPAGPTRRLQNLAAREFWGRLPAGYRVPARVMARLLWIPACPVQAVIESRQSYATLTDVCPAIWDGLTAGKRPAETILQRALSRDEPARIGRVCEIPATRLGTLALAALGDKCDIALASDKLASMEALSTLGLRVPEMEGVLRQGQPPPMDAAFWRSSAKLLIKPQRGSAARGLFSVRNAGEDRYIVRGAAMLTREQLSKRLTRWLEKDSLLVQAYIEPSATTKDLSPDAPVVLRAFVYRPAPGASVAIAGAMLKALPPKMDAPVGVDELLLMPIDPATGILEEGILLGQPRKRWPFSPWNGAPVAGRSVPWWDEIHDALIRASAILPHTPVIGWDILIGPEGPVFLEANTGISLFRAMLRSFEKGVESPIPAMLETWLNERAQAEGNRR